MEWERIRKRREDCAGANLRDYDGCARTFSWTQARGLLDGLPGGGLNIAHEEADRHLRAGRGDRLTLRWIGRDDRIRDYSYSALAPVRQRAGHARGEQGRPGLLYFAALGTLKNGSVFSPLFAAADEECDEGACKDAASL